jgi:OOP family OmpA-OmpF porin
MKAIVIAMALSAGLVNAQTIDNWMASGQPVRNSTGLCWRDANWTPATAHKDCDGAVKPVVAAAPNVVVPKPAPVLAARTPAPVVPEVKKLSYGMDSFFDFDKSVIKPEGKDALTDLVKSMANITLEVAIVVGHTDNVGTEKYNMKLGQRRANAVKAFMVSQGVDAKRIYTESKGESQPVADNKTAKGRALNRRVEIEVIGTVKN